MSKRSKKATRPIPKRGRPPRKTEFDGMSLRKVRHMRGLSANEVQKLLVEEGVKASRQTVVRWELGHFLPPEEVVVALAKILRVRRSMISKELELREKKTT